MISWYIILWHFLKYQIDNIIYYIYIFEIIKTVKKLKIFQELSSIEKNKKTNIQN